MKDTIIDIAVIVGMIVLMVVGFIYLDKEIGKCVTNIREAKEREAIYNAQRKMMWKCGNSWCGQDNMNYNDFCIRCRQPRSLNADYYRAK